MASTIYGMDYTVANRSIQLQILTLYKFHKESREQKNYAVGNVRCNLAERVKKAQHELCDSLREELR